MSGEARHAKQPCLAASGAHNACPVVAVFCRLLGFSWAFEDTGEPFAGAIHRSSWPAAQLHRPPRRQCSGTMLQSKSFVKKTKKGKVLKVRAAAQRHAPSWPPLQRSHNRGGVPPRSPARAGGCRSSMHMLLPPAAAAAACRRRRSRASLSMLSRWCASITCATTSTAAPRWTQSARTTSGA